MMPMLPLRNASAIASGTSASASTTRGAHFFNAGGHFLFLCNGHCPAFFGARLCDVFVGFSLVCLEFCADVVAHIDVGDVDGEDFVGGARVEALVE